MPKPVIITCAPTGGIHTPTMSPHLPITPEDITKASIEAAEAGASVIHLHARDPETGKPDPSAETFMQFLPRIKQSTDAVINVSTGGGLGMTREERLRAALQASPEMASLNVGSLNFGIFPMLEKYDNWKHDWEPAFLEMTRDFIFRNTFTDIEFILKELGEGHGTRFEFECYDLGHLYNLAYFVDKGLVKPPFFVQMVFGVLGGVGADPDNLMHMHTIANKLFGDEYEWSVLAAGRHQMPFATQAAMLGGNLRVGLEDSLFIGKGELATSNAQQVTRIRSIIENLGLDGRHPGGGAGASGAEGRRSGRVLKEGHNEHRSSDQWRTHRGRRRRDRNAEPRDGRGDHRRSPKPRTNRSPPPSRARPRRLRRGPAPPPPSAPRICWRWRMRWRRIRRNWRSWKASTAASPGPPPLMMRCR